MMLHAPVTATSLAVKWVCLLLTLFNSSLAEHGEQHHTLIAVCDVTSGVQKVRRLILKDAVTFAVNFVYKTRSHPEMVGDICRV